MSANARRLLLLSASRAGSTGYLEHALPLIQQFLASDVAQKPGLTIAFVGYAGVFLPNFDAYVERVQNALAPILRPTDKLVGVHQGNPVELVNAADVIVVCSILGHLECCAGPTNLPHVVPGHDILLVTANP
jgi:dipeptidase E